MLVVGRLVGTFEPARVMVAIAATNSASASANTIAPIQAAGSAAGTNRRGTNQSSAKPASTATSHAIGGRTMTFAVSVASAMADLRGGDAGDTDARTEGVEPIAGSVHPCYVRDWK